MAAVVGKPAAPSVPAGASVPATPGTPAAAARDRLCSELLASYMGDERARRLSHRYLPSREAIVEILELVLDLMLSLIHI